MAKNTGKRRSATIKEGEGFSVGASNFKEHLWSLVNRGTAENLFDALSKVTVAARLPLDLVAKLDALAERLSENRTQALCRLLEAGWDQVIRNIDPKTLKVLSEIEERHLKALIDEANAK